MFIVNNFLKMGINMKRKVITELPSKVIDSFERIWNICTN